MSLSSKLGKTKKVDNHAASYGDKVELRRNVLDAIGAGKASVLDCFAGSGHMHRAVWNEASRYVGCDQRFFFDQRTAYVCDNKQILRSLDLSQFNVFDLDAYGSPWEQVLILARRRIVAKGEQIGLCMTDGTGLKLKFGGLPAALAEIANVPADAAGAFKNQDHLTDAALANLARMMRCRIVKRWQAKRPGGASMCYTGLVLGRQA